MARKPKDQPDNIKLRQPDRSAPNDQTLLQFAQQQDLFRKAQHKELQLRKKDAQIRGGKNDQATEYSDAEDGSGLSPTAERIMDSILWTVSLAMLHFTLDVLVQNQYAVEISWSAVSTRAVQAFFVFFMLFYSLHSHSSNPTLLPVLPAEYQDALRHAIFFVTSIVAGCYLIHISNRYGYLAIMKQAPPLGCLWVWSVIELDLPLAVLSLVCAALFLWQGGYDFK